MHQVKITGAPKGVQGGSRQHEAASAVKCSTSAKVKYAMTPTMHINKATKNQATVLQGPSCWMTFQPSSGLVQGVPKGTSMMLPGNAAIQVPLTLSTDSMKESLSRQVVIAALHPVRHAYNWSY